MLKVVWKDATGVSDEIHINNHNCDGLDGPCSHMVNITSWSRDCDINGEAIKTLEVCKCPNDDSVSGYQYVNGTKPGDELKVKKKE